MESHSGRTGKTEGVPEDGKSEFEALAETSGGDTGDGTGLDSRSEIRGVCPGRFRLSQEGDGGAEDNSCSEEAGRISVRDEEALSSRVSTQ